MVSDEVEPHQDIPAEGQDDEEAEEEKEDSLIQMHAKHKMKQHATYRPRSPQNLAELNPGLASDGVGIEANANDSEPQVDEDDDNNGDGISKPLSNPTKDQPAEPVKENSPGLPFNVEDMKVFSPQMAYNVSESVSSRRFNNIGFPLSYGSAELEGFKYKDTVCLLPMDLPPDQTSMVQLDHQLKKHFCVRHFRF